MKRRAHVGFESESFRDVQYRTPSVELDTCEIDASVLSMIPRELCETHHVIPVAVASGVLVVATSTPNDAELTHILTVRTGCKVAAVLAPDDAIIRALRRHFDNAR